MNVFKAKGLLLSALALCFTTAIANADDRRVIHIDSTEFCNQSLDGGSLYILSQDLACPVSHGEAALTLRSDAELRLNGKTLTCLDPVAMPPDQPSYLGTGVLVVGEGNTVIGDSGSVRGCGVGMELAGEGQHTVRNVVMTENGNGVSENSRGIGFLVSSSGNQIIDSVARDNAVAGFRVEGITEMSGQYDVEADPEGIAEHVRAINAEAHLEGLASYSNLLYSNEAHENGVGFYLEQTAGAYLFNNVSQENKGTGFWLANNSVNNTILFNRSKYNDDPEGSGAYGILIQGNGNTVANNIASNNDFHGIMIDGTNNDVSDNTTSSNTGNGIFSIGSNDPYDRDNRIHDNVASLNSSWDLRDFYDNCAGNDWQRNAGDAFQGCVN